MTCYSEPKSINFDHLKIKHNLYILNEKQEWLLFWQEGGLLVGVTSKIFAVANSASFTVLQPVLQPLQLTRC